MKAKKPARSARKRATQNMGAPGNVGNDAVSLPSLKRKVDKLSFSLVSVQNQVAAENKTRSSLLSDMDAGDVVVSRPISRTNMRVQKEEYVGDIEASVPFAQTCYLVNPGLPASFPLLSQIARNYDRYRFRNLVYFFKPTASGFAGAAQTGRVAVALNYDVVTPVATAMIYLLDTDPHVATTPFVGACVLTQAERLNKIPLFVRTEGSYPAGQSPTLYDAGRVCVGVEGCPAVAGKLGELWVKYDVDLYTLLLTPTAGPAVGPAPPNSSCFMIAPGVFNMTSGVTYHVSWAATNYGDYIEGWNTLGITTPNPNTDGVFTLPAGIYRIQAAATFDEQGATNVITQAYISGSVGGHPLSAWQDSSLTDPVHSSHACANRWIGPASTMVAIHLDAYCVLIAPAAVQLDFVTVSGSGTVRLLDANVLIQAF